jgi:hypothetical protein
MIKDFTNFQGLSSEQGRDFRDQCVKALLYNEFVSASIEEKFVDVGIQLDIIATNKHGISLAIECKGSMRGDRPGSRRTDSVLKAVGEAYLFRQSEAAAMFPPMLLMTSHIADDKAARAMLGAVATDVIADVFHPYHTRRIRWWANATIEDVDDHLLQFKRVEELLRANW